MLHCTDWSLRTSAVRNTCVQAIVCWKRRGDRQRRRASLSAQTSTEDFGIYAGIDWVMVVKLFPQSLHQILPP